MERILILSIVISILFCNCDGQNTLKQKKEQDQKNSPSSTYKVNKEYDENGNLIRYDSTYSYFYSNVEGDSSMRDSILDVFKQNFNQQYFFSDDPFFNDFFFQDSLINYDFYKKDFFSNRYKDNMKEFDQFFQEMDSIKNEFFKHQFQEQELPKPKKPVYSL